MPVTISGTASSTFTDSDFDGARDPGETLHNVIRVVNSGDTDAQNVTVTDPLNGSTIDAGSVQITPIAVDDGFSITGNTPITFTAAQLLGNDIDPDGPEASLVITGVSAGANGNVVDNGNGTYTFIPTTGLNAGQTATFTYTVQDEDGLSNVTGYEGTVTLTIADVTWYVNNNYGGANGASDGSYLRPFTNMNALNGVTGDGTTDDDVDDVNDTIFVYHNGTATSGAITLENGQSLFGDGHAYTVNGLTIGNDGSNTTLTASSGSMVTLGQNNTIDGIILSGTGTAGGITGNGFGTLTVSSTAIDVAGQALNLTNGTVAGTGFQSVDSDGGASNVSLTSVAGTVNLGGGALSGATGASFNVSGGTATIDYNGTIAQTNNAAAVSVTNHATGSITFDGAVSATNGTGLQFSNADGTYDFNGQVTLNGGDAGVDIINGSGGTFTFDHLSNAITNNSGGDAFVVDGVLGTPSNANVTWNGNITDNNGNAVFIDEHDGGTIVFQNGTISSNSGGVDVTNSNGGSVTFNTQVTLSTGANAGVNLVGNTGSTIAFNTTGNGLDITTTSGTGFNATGGGTVTVTGSGNTVTTTTGTAVNVSNVTIGAAGLTWQSINTNGAATTGINLVNTGSGAFTVTGTGAANSGGTINGAFTGINLSNAGALNLTQVNITNSLDDGIFGSNVVGLSLTNVDIQGFTGSGSNFDRGLEFSNLTGVATVVNSTFTNSPGHLFNIYNNTGQLNLTVTGSTFSGSQVSGAGGDDGMLIEANGTSTIIASITGSTFSNNEGDHFQWGTDGGSSTGHLTFSGNTLTNSPLVNPELLGGGITISPSGNSDLTFAVTNNNTTGNNQGGAIDITAVSSTSAMLFQGTVSGNTIGNAGVAESGSAQASGIQADNSGNGTMIVAILNNTITQTDGNFAIEVVQRAGTGAGGNLHATVAGNTVTNPGTNQLNAIRINGGTSLGTDQGNMFLDIRDNNVDTTLSQDIRVTSNGDVNMFFENLGLANAGGGGNAAAVDTYLEGRNPGGENASVFFNATDNSSVMGSTGDVQAPLNPTLPLLAVPPEAPLAPDDGDSSGPDAGDAGGTDTTGDAGGPDAGGGDGGDTPATGGDAPAPAHPVIVDDGVLSQAELDYLVEAAIQRWIAAGASEAQVAAMRATEFSVVDMVGIYLGTSTGSSVQIDSDGAGFGWFLDGTPGDDSEFTGSGTRLAGTGAAANRIDLLTTILHELGHRAGLEDSYQSADRDSLMYGYVTVGERRLPADGEAAGATPDDDDDHAAFMLGPVNIGTLPAGTAVEIYYDSVVGPFGNQVIGTPFTSTPTVTGSNFANYNVPQTTLNVDTLTLGNLVFLDANKNGIFDAGDSGINGVTLSLFADADNNGVADGGAIATATTAGGGVYQFANLAAGNYIVRIDAANFTGVGALVGLGPTASAGDPDNNTDNDSNGGAFSGGAVFSQTITLAYNTEPVAGIGNDANATLDFGLIVPNAAPTITSLDGDTATYTEGGAPVRIDVASNAAVSDGDSADFGGGSISFEVTGNEVPAEDVLLLLTDALVTVSVTLEVAVGGTTIGTITSGGVGGAPLTISLNSSATPALVQQLIRNVAYINTNGVDPDTDARTVTITLVDGDGTAGGGSDTVTRTVTVNVAGVDDPGTAVDDAFATDEATAITTGNLLAPNGSGEDTDADGGPAPAVAAVNGLGANVGAQITLASGALLTANADGTFSYDPAGAFDYLPGAASGASNLTTTDSFTYSLGGNTATVTVTISGLDTDDTLLGTAGNDTLDGGVGFNTLSYANAGAGVTVALLFQSTPQNTVGAGIDVFVNIQNLTGSGFVDNLVGDDEANVIDGGGAADLMLGLGGDDTYVVSQLGDLAVEADGEGEDEVRASISYNLTGQYIENLTLTGSAAINGFGNTLDNILTGNAGVNLLFGDGGNDTYVIQTVGDQAIELAGGGTDLVQSSVDYSLAGQHVENLTLTGTAVAGTGNSLDNWITGNGLANLLTGAGGNDTLVGGGGADVMRGGTGDDAYFADNVADLAIEYDGQGHDAVVATGIASYNLVGTFIEDLTFITLGSVSGTGNGLDNQITGGAFGDTLVGNGGNDTLIGLGGADTMHGGAGDDIFVVDDTGDVAIELAGEGTDTVQSSATYFLGAQFVENLTLTGIAAVNGTGNGLDNLITGNAAANVLYGREGNDTIDGGDGADIMRGEQGNDTYHVDQLGDFAIEYDGEGSDTVIATISYDLAGQYIETLILGGAGAINGTGNGQGNSITGNGAANVLNGRDGNDVLDGAGGADKLIGGDGIDQLTGGAGADEFYFTSPAGAADADTITDFEVGVDTIVLDRSVFAALGLGALADGAFVVGTAATDANDRILYDSATGTLRYDADGTGGAAAVVFATIGTGLALTADDFFVIP